MKDQVYQAKVLPRIPWNKGRTGFKLSEEHKRKISEGIKKHLPKTGFKKGHIPWTSGKKFIVSLGPSGKNHYHWKGGRKVVKGYILIKSPSHPFANASKYVMEHRLIIEKYLGRYLLKNEISHHVNKNKKDNQIENLMLFSSHSAHIKFEHGKLINPKEIVFDGRSYEK